MGASRCRAGDAIDIDRSGAGVQTQCTGIERELAARGAGADFNTDPVRAGKGENRAAGRSERHDTACTRQQIEGGAISDREAGGVLQGADGGGQQGAAADDGGTIEGVGVAERELVAAHLDQIHVVLDHPTVAEVRRGAAAHREGVQLRGGVGDVTATGVVLHVGDGA